MTGLTREATAEYCTTLSSSVAAHTGKIQRKDRRGKIIVVIDPENDRPADPETF